MRTLAICMLAACGVVRGQIAVDEGATRATLVDGATHVYLALNSGFQEPVAVQVKMEWLDLSDRRRSPVELKQAAAPGKSFLDVRMAFGEKHDPLLDRLHYSVAPDASNVTAFPKQEGMLSFPNIAEHAFILTGVGVGDAPRPGSPYEFRIFASHPLTGRPVGGVVVTADQSSATTDANGAAVLRVKPDPEDWDEPDKIKVEGQLGDVWGSAEIWHPAMAREMVRIYTDKPLYQPGQTAHVRILATGSDTKVRAEEEYSIRIVDQKANVVHSADVTTSRFGVASTDWEIPSEGIAGRYRIEVASEEDESFDQWPSREIEVRRYELPAFRVMAKAEHKFYLMFERPMVEVYAEYLFGKPVANGKVTIVAGDDQAAICEGRLDAQGRFRHGLNVPTDLDLPGGSRYIDLHYTAFVTDPMTNRTEQQRFDIRFSHDLVHIYVVRQEISKVGVRLYVVTYRPDGEPVKADVEAISKDRILATGRTDRFGVARLEFAEQDNVAVRARTEEGTEAQEVEPWPGGPRPEVRLTTNHALYRSGQPIRCAVTSAKQDLTGTLMAWREDGRVLFSRAVQLRNGKSEAEIPYGSGFPAKVMVGFISPLGHWYDAGRVVLYPGSGGLRIAAQASKPTYQPGERVGLSFQSTNGKGSPVQAALGIVVVDESVFDRDAADQAARRPRWFTEAAADRRVGGLGLQDILNLPAKIDPDYDLVAEALLEPGVLVNPGDNFAEEQKSAYQREAMSLAPVEKKLDDYYTRAMTYPRDASSVAAIAGKELSEARDPWLQPYKVGFEVSGPNAELRFISAGPDKKFGTADDIVAATVSREWAFPFKTLIEEALEKQEDYPATEAELAALLQKGGIWLAGVHDPWGTALRVTINHRQRKRIIEFRSAGPDRAFDTADDFQVATFEGNYFSGVEARIEKVLNSAAEFPADQGQVRAVLKPAGIDLEALRDPWGHPYELVFRTALNGALHIIDVRSLGQDGIRNTYDDFDVAFFSRGPGGNLRVDAPDPSGPSPSATLDGRGNIAGVITDPVGDAVSGAEAVLDGEYRTRSDQNGRYYFVGVPPGKYTVEVEAAGFRKSFFHDVAIRAGHTTLLDVVVSVGGADEAVAVKAETMLAQVRTGVATYTPRVREYFPETLFWNPELVTDARGRATVDFQLADSLTTWRVAVIGSTVDGRIAETSAKVKAFQPFFAELDPPQVLTTGDEIALPVPVRNYLETAQNVSVEVAAPSSLVLDGPAKQVHSVGASSSAISVLKLRAAGMAKAAHLKVTARGGAAADAIEKAIAIHPDGERVSRSASDIVGGGRALHIEIPEGAIQGSLQSEVVIYPSLLAPIIESMEGLLKRPYGCGEQTISSTYPNLLFLRMTKQAKVHDTRLEQRAQRNLASGYQRLLGYRTGEGGFAYWHNQPADAALTAYAIAFLEDAKGIIDVDEGVVSAARSWLNGQPAGKGGASGLVLSALARGDRRFEEATASQLPELARSAEGTDEPYLIAAFVLAALDAKKPELARGGVERLRKLAREDHDMVSWSGESMTPFHGWGRAGTIETTALAVTALARWRKQAAAEPELDRLIDRGIIYLVRSKDEYGTWWSTQASVRVLGALMEKLGQTSGAKADSIEVLVNDVSTGAVKPGSAPITIDVTGLVMAGKPNEVTIKTGNRALVQAQFRASWYEPWKAAKTSPDLGLEVAYSAKEAATNEAVRCDVSIARRAVGGDGMMIAEIGLPPGAEVDRRGLADLMEHGSAGVDSFEVAPDHVTFYVWPRANESKFSFAFRPRYPMRARTAPSVLYDYYNPEVRVVVPPVVMTVEDK